MLLALLLLALLLLSRPAGSQQSAEADLLAWVGEGIEFDSPVTIGDTEFGRGLVLKRDVPKDGLLLFVPQAKALSLESCAMAPAHKQVLRSLVREQDKYVLVALALLYEHSLGAASRFAPYVDSLPREPPRNLFSWSRDQIELGMGLLGADKVPETAAHCPADVKRALAELAAKESGWFDKLTWATDVSDELAAWVCSMAFSRNFNGELMPLVDMANHKFRVQTGDESLAVTFDPSCLPPSSGKQKSREEWAAVKDCADRTAGAGMGFMSTRNWKEGEQVTDFYGWHGNIYMLMIYGFAETGASGNGVFGQHLVLPLLPSDFATITATFSAATESDACQQKDAEGHSTYPCRVMSICSKYAKYFTASVAEGKVHFPQRLTYDEKSGVAELLSDCTRVGSYFQNAEELDAAIATEGFALYARELRAPPTPRTSSRTTRNWEARDRAHFLAIQERCDSVQQADPSAAMARVEKDAEEGEDWVSSTLLKVVQEEISAAERCSSTMAERLASLDATAATAASEATRGDEKGAAAPSSQEGKKRRKRKRGHSEL
jgi:hypothetical protein